MLSACVTLSVPPLHADSAKPSLSRPVTPAAGSEGRTLAPYAPSARFASQVLAEDTVWNGSIQVDGMVTVAPQATLTIMPGTVVRFAADAGILVFGRIVARGTAAQPLLFTANYLDPAAADWYGIVLTGTAKKNIFEQVRLQGAETGLLVRFSSVELKQLRVEHAVTALKFADAIVDLSDGAFSGCFSGISAVKSEVDLERVTIDTCETGLTVTASSLTATGLTISASAQSAFIAEKSQLKIAKSLFSANRSGAMVIECGGSVTRSQFSSNVETAVVLSGSSLSFSANLVSGSKVGIQLVDTLPAVWGNSITGNSSYNILYSGDEHMYLGGNWLGSSNRELVNKTLFSKRPGALKLMPLLTTDPWKDVQKNF